MALEPLRDLEVRRDVKGGSPKSPSVGIPVAEYQQYAVATNGNGVWKAIASGLAGMVIGLLVAWFTAIQSRGITLKELQEYVDKYSPVLPKDMAIQSSQIGELRGKQERIFERLAGLENNEKVDEKEVTEFKAESRKNNEYVANFIEEQRKAKK